MEYRWRKNVSDHCDYIICILKILYCLLPRAAQPQLTQCVVKTSDTVQMKRKQTKPQSGLRGISVPTYTGLLTCPGSGG